MNGLVAYDSSSDEERESSKNEPSRQAKPNSKNQDPIKDGFQEDLVSLIGPTMPTQLPESYGTTSLDELPNSISEQDLIRHLTQASHPMEEIPPSPPASPDPSTETRFKKFLALKAQGLHFNEDLATKSSFRNPALFATLLEKNGLDGSAQYASSLPPSLWNPQSLPAYGYKEELARSQQSIRDQNVARKKQAAATSKRTIEFAPASGSGSVSSSRTSTPDAVHKPLG